MQRLCVTISAPTTADLRRQRDAVVDADLIELRLDTVRDPDVHAALEGRRRPAIVTCRAAWEGGSFRGSEEERRRILSDAIAAGAEWIDVEARAGFDDLIARAHGTRVVLSEHHFGGVPSDLEARIRALRARGADVVKVAASTTRLGDCVTLLQIARACREEDHRRGLVIVGMGESGAITRAWPSGFGSIWSYAGTLETVGQLTPATLVNEFRFRSLGTGTALYGIAGLPVGHSVSPAMHNAAFGAAGIDAIYLPLPAVDVEDFVRFATAFGLKGASVTIPYKVQMFERVNDSTDLASRVGAVNTIRMTGDRWTGDNTDVQGFLAPLMGRVALGGARAAVAGTGGAARAVAIGLASQNARVTVHGRDRRRAAEVAALVAGAVGGWPPEPGSWDLLVNCTPVGMHPRVNETPIPPALLTGAVVYDLVYNPPKTRLLEDAERAGCRTIGGLEMLVGQARQAFEWWTGVPPSADVMRRAAEQRLAEFVDYGNHVV